MKQLNDTLPAVSDVYFATCCYSGTALILGEENCSMMYVKYMWAEMLC